MLEFYDCEVDYVPKESHHKLGKAERGNAAWRYMFRAKDVLMKPCGVSSQMALFGIEPTIPDVLTGEVDVMAFSGYAAKAAAAA